MAAASPRCGGCSSLTVTGRAYVAGHDARERYQLLVGIFFDRRNTRKAESDRPERRQFGSSHSGLTADGRELALAIDEYKIRHHRRYLTCDEMLSVLGTLGYIKQA